MTLLEPILLYQTYHCKHRSRTDWLFQIYRLLYKSKVPTLEIPSLNCSTIIQSFYAAVQIQVLDEILLLLIYKNKKTLQDYTKFATILKYIMHKKRQAKGNSHDKPAVFYFSSYKYNCPTYHGNIS